MRNISKLFSDNLDNLLLRDALPGIRRADHGDHGRHRQLHIETTSTLNPSDQLTQVRIPLLRGHESTQSELYIESELS